MSDTLCGELSRGVLNSHTSQDRPVRYCAPQRSLAVSTLLAFGTELGLLARFFGHVFAFPAKPLMSFISLVGKE